MKVNVKIKVELRIEHFFLIEKMHFRSRNYKPVMTIHDTLSVN